MKHTPTPILYNVCTGCTDLHNNQMPGCIIHKKELATDYVKKSIYDELLELLKDVLGFIYHGHHALHTTTESHEYIEKIEKAIQAAEKK